MSDWHCLGSDSSQLEAIGKDAVLVTSEYAVFISSKEWSVGFQTKPAECIVVHGCKPTKEEFRDAMRHSFAPLVLIDALYVSAAMVFDKGC